MTKFEEELMATAKMIPTSDGNEIKFKTSSALYDYLLLSNGEAELYLESQLQQQALPVVPECVAKWIEELKGKGYGPLKNPCTYGEAISELSDKSLEKILNWISINQEKFMRAWLDGYTVEKPQLFYIELPNVYGLSDSVFVSKVENGTILEFTKGKDYALAFTEQEIKSIDERYWLFAVPVEDNK